MDFRAAPRKRTASVSVSDGKTAILAVEALPDGRWKWIVRVSGHIGLEATGANLTDVDAMADAMSAARKMIDPTGQQTAIFTLLSKVPDQVRVTPS